MAVMQYQRSRHVRRLVLTLTLALTIVLVSGGRAAAADQVVYGDGLANGWQNWSWSSSVHFLAWGGYNGSQAMAWQVTGAWGGLYLHTDSAVQTVADSALELALLATQWNQRLLVAVYGADGRPVGHSRPLAELGGDPAPGRWTTYRIPLASLGAGGQRIAGVILQDATGAPQATIMVDEVRLTGTALASVPVAGASGCGGVPAYGEIRWENSAQNGTPGRPTDPGRFWGHPGWRAYYDRIDGACTGTTEQILEWAARKWGFDRLGYPDLAKAMAVLETWWRQASVGNHGEIGILQVHPVNWPDWEPGTWSTAYAADYAMAVVRSHYDGASWLGDATKGDLRGSVAAWYCGCAYSGGDWYASWVFQYYETKPWKRPGQPPEWF
jgi:hypothetical protein